MLIETRVVCNRLHAFAQICEFNEMSEENNEKCSERNSTAVSQVLQAATFTKI